ncbi:unnamed protein product, partial [Ectocarpus sp. 12 AP-2014]
GAPASRGPGGALQGGVAHMAGTVAGAAGAGGQQSKSVAVFRSLELCDLLKLEIGNITSQMGQHQEEREEYEKKFRQQLAEMDRIQHSLKQLQEAHMVMKQQYEDEIVRLRHQLESSHPLKSDPDSRGGGAV